MYHKLIDNYTEKVLGEFDTAAGAQKALSRLLPEEGRYEIQSPKARKPRAKKTDVQQESE